MLAIVGESGCGKSTLGRLLLHLLPPTAGDLLYEGQSVAAMPPRALRALRRDLQIVFQDPFASLNPRMKVEAIVGEPIWLHESLSARERRERVHDLLGTVGLQPSQAALYPHEFSGGQRQRIAIARALASRPRLILGDEIVSALDVSVQAKIVNLLEDLKERLCLTMIIIAHGLSLVRHMADRVAVMLLGEIVELASVDELFETPLHPYTRGLLAAAPEPGGGGPPSRWRVSKANCRTPPRRRRVAASARGARTCGRSAGRIGRRLKQRRRAGKLLVISGWRSRPPAPARSGPRCRPPHSSGVLRCSRRSESRLTAGA